MTIDSLERYFHLYKVWFVRSIPGVAAGLVLFILWLNLVILKAFGLQFGRFGSLNSWRVPYPLIWAVILALAMVLVPNGLTRTIGLNFLILFTLVFFLQGIAILSCFFERWRFPLFLRVVLFFFATYFFPFVSLLGAFDMWLNLRKLPAASS